MKMMIRRMLLNYLTLPSESNELNPDRETLMRIGSRVEGGKSNQREKNTERDDERF